MFMGMISGRIFAFRTRLRLLLTFCMQTRCVLEAGCGVGAQTTTLAGNNPKAHITSVDISEASFAEARKRVAVAALKNLMILEI
jgi:tRNA G46 methylase TrmB